MSVRELSDDEYEYQLTYLGHVLDVFDTEGEAKEGRQKLWERIQRDEVPAFLGSDDVETIDEFPIRRRLVL